MKNFPTTITTENFNDAQQFVLKALTKVKRKALLQKLVKPIGSILFLFLSLLLVYGAVFSLSDAEDMMVFKDLTFITDIWERFSGLLTTPDMAWYIYWPILIVAMFVIPILVSAVITIIVSVAYKPATSLSDEGSEAEKAKALHQAAATVEAGNTESDKYTIAMPIIFISILAIFILYAFFVVKIGFSAEMVVGIIIACAVLYYVYMLLFVVFEALLSYFYGNKSYGNIAASTDAYWLSVDPEEAARRKEEEERKEREKEAARARATANRELGAEKRVRALEAESRGQYSLAKSLFKEAAELGDALGMDNYARHCLINGNHSDAIYWLQKSIDTGEADYTSRELLAALKSGQHIDVHYN